MALATGQILDGKYRIIREIGHGAMGAVYEGENIMIHRRVAIKVLHPALAENTSTVQRFEREAQAAGRIGSDHIVEVLDLGSLRDGSYYMVMEFLEGLTLSMRIRSRGRLAPREIAPIGQQILTGLEAAHKAGIIHRDLKPDNVFLQESRAGQADFVKILDFGVSKFNPLNAEEHLALTRAGAVVGTPFYMSPEQAKGSRDVDGRADLYSLGVILYESVTGQKPFHAGTFSELIFKIVLEAPPPPEHFVPELDPAFSRIIRRAMAREPGERYQTGAEMRDALSIWLHTGRDVAPGTQLAAPLPPPPSGAERGHGRPPPGSPEDDNPNAATRIMDDDGCATCVVDQSPAAQLAPQQAPAPLRSGARPPAPPSRRPARTAPLPQQAPAAGGAPMRPAAPQHAAPATTAPSPAAQRNAPQRTVPMPEVAAAPAAAPGAAAAAAALPQVPSVVIAATPTAAAPAKVDGAPAPQQPWAGTAAPESATPNDSLGLPSREPTPPRGIPGLQPLASRRTLWMLGGGAVGVLALTAVGIGTVVATSPTPEETGAETTTAPQGTEASAPLEPITTDSPAAEPPPTGEPAGSAEPTAPPEETASPPPEEPVSPKTTSPARPPRLPDESPPPAAPKPPTATAPAATTATTPPATATGTGTTNGGKKGRTYATEL